jgi:hypothetical protein
MKKVDAAKGWILGWMLLSIAWGYTQPVTGTPTQGMHLSYRPGTFETDLDRLAKAGVQSVLLEWKSLPQMEQWRDAIRKLEQGKFAYWFAFSPLAVERYAKGWLVQPERYRLTPSKEGVYNLRFPGAERALMAVVDRSDASLKRALVLDVRNDRTGLAMPGDPENEVLLFYPLARTQMPDLWEGWDTFRDKLLALLKEAKPGTGFRGWINLIALPPDEDAVACMPDSPLFRVEWQSFLQTRYKEIGELERDWGLEGEIGSFERAAHMIPLWRMNRGLPFLWNPAKPDEKPLDISIHRSALQRDYRDYLNSRLIALASAIQQALRPLTGEALIYALQQPPSLKQPPLLPNYTGSRAGLENLCIQLPNDSKEQWSYRMASYALEAKPRNPLQRMLILELSAEQFESAPLILARARALGYQQIFWQLPVPESMPDEFFKTQLATDEPPAKQTEWLPFPVSLWQPAEFTRLPDGRWWLPSETTGSEVLDWGESVHAYWTTVETPEGRRIQLCLWSDSETQEVTLRRLDDTTLTALATDGKPVEVRVRRDRITLQVGTTPVLLTGFQLPPLCETAVNEYRARFALAEKAAVQADINFTIPRFNFQQALSLYARNPVEGYRLILNSVHEAERVMRSYLRLEAEHPQEHTFSTIRENPAASGRSTLWLSTPLSPSTAGYYASYTFTASRPGEYMLWLSTSTPGVPIVWSLLPATEPEATPVAKGQIPDPDSEEYVIQGGYGGTFRWVRLGTMTLKPGEYRLQLRLAAGKADWYSAEWDALLITPPGLQPSGR